MTKIISGLATFMTIASILALNPGIMSATGMDKSALFTATALSTLVATLDMVNSFMISPIQNIDLNDITRTLLAFVTFLMMPLSISEGR